MFVFHTLRGAVALLKVTARSLFTQILTFLRICGVYDCLLVLRALLSGLLGIERSAAWRESCTSPKVVHLAATMCGQVGKR
jgi:hypothetical protein